MASSHSTDYLTATTRVFDSPAVGAQDWSNTSVLGYNRTLEAMMRDHNPAAAALLEDIRRRLRVSQGSSLPFEYIAAYHDQPNDKVLVFVVKAGKPAIIEDGWDLFPSDTLITQLRLLQK